MPFSTLDTLSIAGMETLKGSDQCEIGVLAPASFRTLWTKNDDERFKMMQDDASTKRLDRSLTGQPSKCLDIGHVDQVSRRCTSKGTKKSTKRGLDLREALQANALRL